MLADVGERFLRRSVGHQRHAHGQRLQGLHRRRRQLQPAGDAGAALETLGEPLQRGHQPLLQDGRAQVLHDALAGLDGVRERLQRRDGAARHGLVAGMAADPVELELQRRERAADLIVDLAGDSVALGLHAGLQVLRQLRKPPARFGQLAVGRLAGAVRGRGGQRVLGGHRQAREVALEQVVAGALAHGLHGRVLADLARDQDERHRPAAAERLVRAQERQRVQAREAGQVVVGDDQVPGFGQRGAELLARVHAAFVQHQPAPAQLGHHQRVVQLGVFQVQQPHRGAHGGQYRKAGAGSRRRR